MPRRAAATLGWPVRRTLAAALFTQLWPVDAAVQLLADSGRLTPRLVAVVQQVPVGVSLAAIGVSAAQPPPRPDFETADVPPPVPISETRMLERGPEGETVLERDQGPEPGPPRAPERKAPRGGGCCAGRAARPSAEGDLGIFRRGPSAVLPPSFSFIWRIRIRGTQSSDE